MSVSESYIAASQELVDGRSSNISMNFERACISFESIRFIKEDSTLTLYFINAFTSDSFLSSKSKILSMILLACFCWILEPAFPKLQSSGLI